MYAGQMPMLSSGHDLAKACSKCGVGGFCHEDGGVGSIGMDEPRGLGEHKSFHCCDLITIVVVALRAAAKPLIFSD
jgi:hypothetical protein